jgi:hypothetical protein
MTGIRTLSDDKPGEVNQQSGRAPAPNGPTNPVVYGPPLPSEAEAWDAADDAKPANCYGWLIWSRDVIDDSPVEGWEFRVATRSVSDGCDWLVPPVDPHVAMGWLLENGFLPSEVEHGALRLEPRFCVVQHGLDPWGLWPEHLIVGTNAGACKDWLRARRARSYYLPE